MSKAIFMGDDYYTRLGMKNILRGTSLYYGMQYYATSSPPSSLPVVQNNDYLIIHPEETDILKYASIIRRLSSRASLMLFVLTNVETFAVFQTICGMQMHFLDRTLSLDALHGRVIQLINCKNTSVNRPLDNAMSVNEFNVMMMYSRGWSLSRIATIAHKSEKLSVPIKAILPKS